MQIITRCKKKKKKKKKQQTNINEGLDQTQLFVVIEKWRSNPLNFKATFSFRCAQFLDSILTLV